MPRDRKFDAWNEVKQHLQDAGPSRTFNEREVWWCSIGMNIGYELFGKGRTFSRPVLIVNKHNRHTFFGLPLGSVVKPASPYHFKIAFGGRAGSVFLSQGRTLSSKRLGNLMGKIPQGTFDEIIEAYQNTFKKDKGS